MKNILILSLLLLSCGSSRTTVNNARPLKVFTPEEILDGKNKGGSPDRPQNAEPGKCYAKVTHNGFLVWSEILCASQITKGLVQQIHSDLLRLGYSVSDDELASGKYGESTMQGLKAFQIDNNMAYGGLTQETIDRLKSK